MISQTMLDALQAQLTLERTNAAYYDALLELNRTDNNGRLILDERYGEKAQG